MHTRISTSLIIGAIYNTGKTLANINTLEALLNKARSITLHHGTDSSNDQVAGKRFLKELTESFKTKFENEGDELARCFDDYEEEFPAFAKSYSIADLPCFADGLQTFIGRAVRALNCVTIEFVPDEGGLNCGYLREDNGRYERYAVIHLDFAGLMHPGLKAMLQKACDELHPDMPESEISQADAEWDNLLELLFSTDERDVIAQTDCISDLDFRIGDFHNFWAPDSMTSYRYLHGQQQKPFPQVAT